jgi:hypothetical protein
MQPSSRSARTTASLSDSVNRHLNMYTLTATAAGVGMMALAQPVQAKIVYTPAHKNFSQYPPLALDLNHDGTVDFYLALGGEATSDGGREFAWVYPPRGLQTENQDVATAKGGYESAVALRSGSRIGSGRLFGSYDILAEHFSHFGKGGSSSTAWADQWANGGKGLKDRYLGLKFTINGETHYGWARVTVTTNGKNFTATLTGYAYETIANKAIIAGKTQGPNEESREEQPSTASSVAATPATPTLGMLALGAPAVGLWRR